MTCTASSCVRCRSSSDATSRTRLPAEAHSRPGAQPVKVLLATPRMQPARSCQRTCGLGSRLVDSAATCTPRARATLLSSGTTAFTSWAALMRMLGRMTSTATTCVCGLGPWWSHHRGMRRLHGRARRLSSAATAYSSSEATPRRMATTSTTCLSSTFHGLTGRASTLPTSRACARTTPASCMRLVSTSLGGSTPSHASRTSTNTASTTVSGLRFHPRATCQWAGSATLQWCASQECLSLVAGMGMTRWMTSTSFPWQRNTGTASLAAGTYRPHGTATVLPCMAVACSSSAAWTSGRHVSLTSASSTLTRGRGRGWTLLAIRLQHGPSTVQQCTVAPCTSLAGLMVRAETTCTG
mmetsp:Transcript_113316/g.366187  ORF Transcript_113316/g.366187 Transcript_113316/m.366187 type:complete len:354 (-) Transcript_113316:425-1486(-)